MFLFLFLVFFLVFLVGLPVLFLYLKFRENDARIKTDEVQFDTLKSVSQITSVIRSLDCKIERLEYDALDDNPVSAIAVLLTGEPNFKDMLKHPSGSLVRVWGVQVIVDDLGDRRHVTLIALGQNGVGTYNDKSLGMAFSRDYRNKIAEMLA